MAFSFPTQQWSVLHPAASARVMDAWFREVAHILADPKVIHPVKHGVAVRVKAAVIREAMECAHEMAEQCGAQGTSNTNFIARHIVNLSVNIPLIDDDSQADLNSIIIIAE